MHRVDVIRKVGSLHRAAPQTDLSQPQAAGGPTTAATGLDTWTADGRSATGVKGQTGIASLGSGHAADVVDDVLRQIFSSAAHDSRLNDAAPVCLFTS